VGVVMLEVVAMVAAVSGRVWWWRRHRGGAVHPIALAETSQRMAD